MFAYQHFEAATLNGGATVTWQAGRLSPMADVFVFETIDGMVCLYIGLTRKSENERFICTS